MSALQRWGPRIALLALLVYFAGWNLAFIRIDTRPPNNNELNHILPSVDLWLRTDTRPDWFSAYLQAFTFYPPITVLATLAYHLAGPDYDVAMLVQTGFFLLWIAGIYLFCSRAFSRWSGVLAALVLGSFPGALDVSRQFLLEIPMAACITWAAWALLAGRGFSSRGWALAAGALVGLATLSKQTFFVYAAGPALAAMLRALFGTERRRGEAQRLERTGRWSLLRWGLLLALCWIAPLLFYVGPGGAHRQALSQAFQEIDLHGLDPALLLLELSGALATLLVLLLRLRRTPARNAALAALAVTLVASLWYFPRGLYSLLHYIDQMQANVGARESVNRGALVDFYGIFLGQYYLGYVKQWLLSVLAGLLLLGAGLSLVRRAGVRLEALTDGPWPWLTIVLWLAISVAVFLVLPIQNEMNLVPALAPAAALIAGLFHQARLVLRNGAAPSRGARALIALNRAALGALLAVLLLESLLFPTFYQREDGSFRPLPIECGRERDHLALIRALSPGAWREAQPLGVRLRSLLVRRGFYLKFPDFRYFIPFAEDWQLGRLVGMLERNGLAERPVLLPDQGFYFSFNGLIFYLTAAGHQPNVVAWFGTPVPPQGRSLEQAADELQRFDALIVREQLPENEHEVTGEGGEGTDRDLTLQTLRSGRPELLRGLRFVERLPLPEGTWVLVYLRDSQPGAAP